MIDSSVKVAVLTLQVGKHPSFNYLRQIIICLAIIILEWDIYHIGGGNYT